MNVIKIIIISIAVLLIVGIVTVGLPSSVKSYGDNTPEDGWLTVYGDGEFVMDFCYFYLSGNGYFGYIYSKLDNELWEQFDEEHGEYQVKVSFYHTKKKATASIILTVSTLFNGLIEHAEVVELPTISTDPVCIVWNGNWLSIFLPYGDELYIGISSIKVGAV